MSRLTAAADLAWKIGAAEAISGNHPFIEKEHIVIGVLSLEKAMAAEEMDPAVRARIGGEARAIAEALGRLEIDAASLRRKLRELVGRGKAVHDGKPVSRSPACKEAFRRASVDAQGPVSSLRLLSAVIEAPEGAIRVVLEEMSVAPKDLDRELMLAEKRLVVAADVPVFATPTLDRFGRDLTQLAREGKLGPVIGRRGEILQILQTLARSQKNNPVLVGEAGVGKTAIVEALAIRAIEGKDPAVLGAKRIVELQLGTLLAGSKYRGEFEERLSHILEEVRNHPEVIVFIDEIHTVIGAGQVGEATIDAANMMKPALARGELRAIGATTFDEYRRIEEDPALERRFEKVLVEEPTREETLAILRGLRRRWEEHHQVHILETALEAAVDLSVRFDTDHYLPDKAIDLVDKAAARTRIPMLSMMSPGEIDHDLMAGGGGHGEVMLASVAQVLAEKLGLPPDRVRQGLDGGDLSWLFDLEGFLRERLIGQDEAITKVAQRLRLAHSGVKTRRGPLAVFLLLGPTGVGKTEMARLLAEFLFGEELDLVRLDMSEYMEEHSVSKLIGAPPGYVGYDQQGQLVSALRRRPYSVVLLDEVEKAHPRVFDLFLQLFDEGRLTDSRGCTADARSVVFVMTSNLGESREPLGFGAAEEASRAEATLEKARRWFRPELWNRIDEAIVFRHLSESDGKRILRSFIRVVCDNVRQQNDVLLTVRPEAEAFLLRAGFSPSQGVRELQRTVERFLQVPLGNLVLSGKIRDQRSWQAVYDEGGLYLLPTPNEAEVCRGPQM